MDTIFSRLLRSKTTGLLLLLSLLIAAGLLSTNATQQKQHIQQEAAKPTSIINPASLALLPHKSVHHPLHIHGFKHLQNINPAAIALATKGFTPAQIKTAYHLPATGGTGTIAIVDAYYTPNLQQDLNTFDTTFNIPQCTVANGCLTIHFQNNKQPSLPPPGTNWDAETTLDVEWAHATAPTASILVNEAASDQPADLIPGVDYVRQQPGVKSVSMSWIGPEFATQGNFDTIFTSSSGTSFFGASGDTGSGDAWPVASANVIGVGGTTLTLNADNSAKSETAWAGSGGGISRYNTEPAYQTTFGILNANGKRASPDVSLNADPTNSPYLFIFGGNVGAVGGTSVGTPIWAAMNTLSTPQITHALLYQNAKSAYTTYYHDITQGTNGTCRTYCTATSGYDYITGLGSPVTLPQNPPVTPPITLSPTSSPTTTTIATPTLPQASGVSFSLNVLLHVIGKGGDNANPNSDGNSNPLHPMRPITITLLQSNAIPFMTKSGTINFINQTGNFTGTVVMGTISPGNYLAQIKVDGFLPRQIPGIVQIQNNQTTISLPQISLVTGDVNNDNQLDIVDYNLLVSCFSSKTNKSSCTNPNYADSNDDGLIDGIDYNIYLREISVQKGG